ncbi:hypothetical protein [Chitinophaga sp. ARDCPP14]|uniref:hypothetical protein n=1 Tax=Chitinophaga sp. ARDCPP14 TaxID=3391139 RepID=UPI003F5265C1
MNKRFKLHASSRAVVEFCDQLIWRRILDRDLPFNVKNTAASVQLSFPEYRIDTIQSHLQRIFNYYADLGYIGLRSANNEFYDITDLYYVKDAVIRPEDQIMFIPPEPDMPVTQPDCKPVDPLRGFKRKNWKAFRAQHLRNLNKGLD